MTTGLEVAPDPEPTASIFLTTSMPLVTEPKTTCLPSSQSVLTVQRKNLRVIVPSTLPLYALSEDWNLTSDWSLPRHRGAHRSKVHPVGFEPTPPERLGLKSNAFVARRVTKDQLGHGYKCAESTLCAIVTGFERASIW